MDLSDNIDILSLQLMGNKKKYNNYLRKTDNEEIRKINYKQETLNIHKEEILRITKDLIENVDAIYSHDIMKSFEYYTKNIIKNVEMKNMVEKNDDDEDTLFVNMDNNKSIPNFFSYKFER